MLVLRSFSPAPLSHTLTPGPLLDTYCSLPAAYARYHVRTLLLAFNCSSTACRLSTSTVLCLRCRCYGRPYFTFSPCFLSSLCSVAFYFCCITTFQQDESRNLMQFFSSRLDMVCLPSFPPLPLNCCRC